jgi:hypothetical protein
VCEPPHTDALCLADTLFAGSQGLANFVGGHEMVTVMIDIVTDPKSLALVVSAVIMTMVVLGFILRPIWQSWHE